MTTPGQRIYRIRTQQNLSLRECARRAGISKGTLCEIENRPRVQPSERVIEALANVLGVTVEELKENS